MSPCGNATPRHAAAPASARSPFSAASPRRRRSGPATQPRMDSPAECTPLAYSSASTCPRPSRRPSPPRHSPTRASPPRHSPRPSLSRPSLTRPRLPRPSLTNSYKTRSQTITQVRAADSRPFSARARLRARPPRLPRPSRAAATPRAPRQRVDGRRNSAQLCCH